MVIADVPELLMIMGAALAAMPVGTVSVRFTVPLKPFSEVSFSKELPMAPASIVMVEGFALIAKSTTWTMMITV